MGRPSLATGGGFRLLLVGHFEGLDSECGAAWRLAGRPVVRHSRGAGVHAGVADCSGISETRRPVDVDSRRSVFTWVPQRLGDRRRLIVGLLGIDGTRLVASEALRSVGHLGTDNTQMQFLTKLAPASGIAAPARENLAAFGRKRRKQGSKDYWPRPRNPDSLITIRVVCVDRRCSTIWRF